MWNLDTDVEANEFAIPGESVSYAEFSPDGTLIITVSDSSSSLPKLRLWNVKTAEVLHTFDNVFEAHFSADGKYITAPSSDTGPQVFETTTYGRVDKLDPSLDAWLFSSDSKYLLAREGETSVAIWDVQTGMLLQRFTEQTNIPFADILTDENAVLIAQDSIEQSASHRIYSIRDIHSGNEIRELKLSPVITDVEEDILSPDAKHLLIVGGYPHSTLTLWDIQTGNQVQQYC